MLVTWRYIMDIPLTRYGVLGSTVPKLFRIAWICFVVGLIFLNILFDLLSLDYYHDRVFLVFSWQCCGSWCLWNILGSFKYLTRMIMYSGLCNSFRMQCFIFSLNFLYWSLASLCLAVVPNTAQKVSIYPLKLRMEDVYVGWLKRLTRTSRPWWPPLPVKPTWPCPWPLLLALDSLVSETRVIVSSMTFPPFLTTAGEAVYASGLFCI